MGIPIGGGRRNRRRRRSYADYKPNNRNPSRNDPFRVIFYLVLIGAVLWLLYNQSAVRAQVDQQVTGLFTNAGQDQEAGEGGSKGGNNTGLFPERPTPTPNLSIDELIAQGDQAFSEGNILDGIDYYSNAVEIRTNDVELHVKLARYLLYQSAMEYGEQRDTTLEQAIYAANGAILADPYSPAGYAILGKVLDWQGLPDRGLSEIQRAQKLDPDYVLAISYEAEVLVDLDRWDAALETAQRATQLLPNHPDVRRDYAYVLESLGDYFNATAQYEAALQLEPNLPYLIVAVARNYQQVGRYQEAIDRLFEAETLDPGNVLIPFEVGRTYETFLGDPNSALEYYERATEVDDQYPYPWVQIGTIRYQQKSYVQAIPSFEHALELGYETVLVYYYLGMSYAFEGNCQEALPNLNEANSRAEGDESLLEAIQTGYDICQSPGSNDEPGTTDDSQDE